MDALKVSRAGARVQKERSTTITTSCLLLTSHMRVTIVQVGLLGANILALRVLREMDYHVLIPRSKYIKPSRKSTPRYCLLPYYYARVSGQTCLEAAVHSDGCMFAQRLFVLLVCIFAGGAANIHAEQRAPNVAV